MSGTSVLLLANRGSHSEGDWLKLVSWGTKEETVLLAYYKRSN